MSMKAFVRLLEKEETTVEIKESGDNRYFTAVYQFPGDDIEYAVEFFDTEPVVLSWVSATGTAVRVNSEGTPF